MSIGRAVLLPHEAEQAIYVDFEGNKDAPPTLLGVLVEGVITQWIVEDTFHSCVSRRRAKTKVIDLPSVAHGLLDHAEREGRYIVSWSEHDHTLLSAALMSERDQVRLERCYRNAIFTADRWRRACRPDWEVGRNTLEVFSTELSWRLPDDVGTGTVGPTLSAIRKRLQSRSGHWMDLTPGQRANWKGVLSHNRHDLRRMEEVTTRCAQELGGWLGWPRERAA